MILPVLTLHQKHLIIQDVIIYLSLHLNQLFLLDPPNINPEVLAALFPPVANEPSVDNDEDKLKKELENSEPVKSSILKAIK
jgi:hypothetical protein